MHFNLKLTSANIKAIAKGLVSLVRAFDKHPVGAVMLVLAILSIGTAMAISNVQIVMA